MKKTRIGIKKKKRTVNIALSLFFLVVLPAVAVFIGSRITEWVVIPTMNMEDVLKSPGDILSEDLGDIDEELLGKDTKLPPDEIDREENVIKKDQTTILNDFLFNAIQVASVSDSGNINVLLEELANNKLPYIVYKKENLYKVYSYGSVNRVDLDSKIDGVKEFYPDAYIAAMGFNEAKIAYSADEDGTERMIDYINSLLDLIGRESDIILKGMNEEVNISEYTLVLNEHKDLLETMTNEIHNLKFSNAVFKLEDVENLIQYHKKNITESLENINNEMDEVKLTNNFLDTVFRTIEIISF